MSIPPHVRRARENRLGLVELAGAAPAPARAAHADRAVAAVVQHDPVVVFIGKPRAIAVERDVLRSLQPEHRAERGAVSEVGVEHLHAVIARIDDPHAAVGHWVRAAAFLRPTAYEMTSVARSSSDCGTVRPSAFAVRKLISNSNLVGCSHG